MTWTTPPMSERNQAPWQAARILVAIALTLCWQTPLLAQAPMAAELPLAEFDRLVGGQWWMGDDSYHEFEWGLDRQMVKTRSYVVTDGEPKLVSEGVWFWHPGEGAIRGYHVAIEMPVSFFDYTTRFEGDTMISELDSFGEMGDSYEETFEFTSPSEYVWTLMQSGERVMGGTYERRGG